MFQGWIERWPMEFNENGLFPEVTPTVVDSFAILSQTIVKPPFHLDVLAKGPSFFFPLNDPVGATSFVDISGNHAPAPVVASPYGAGIVTAGQGITAATSGMGFLGTGGPVVQMTNPDNSPNFSYQPCSWIELDSVGIKGPAAGAWTRMIAFNNSATGAQNGQLWGSGLPAWYIGKTPSFGIGLPQSGSSDGLSVTVSSASSSLTYVSPSGQYTDGNWHLLFVTLSADGRAFHVYLDGVNVYSNTAQASISPYSPAAVDTIGAQIVPGLNQYSNGYNGYAAHAAEFPYVLQASDISALYTSWRSCWSGDSSGQRYQRILNWIGYRGQTRIDNGQTTNMGPATDLLPSTGAGGNLVTTGTDALTALNNVVITENGNHYIDASGVLTFKSRTARNVPFTPVVVFGEQTANGEVPYEDITFDFDTTQIGNDVQITQSFTNQVFYSEGTSGNPVNSISQSRYGTRTLQRTVNTNVTGECIDASNYYLYRYGDSDLRVSKIRVHVSALYASNPAAWPLMLGLELGSMVTVMRRPLGFPVIQWNGFVEHIQWDMQAAEAFVELQLSPADKYATALYTDLRSTLKNQATAGTNSCVLNPLADSATNSFSSYAYSGMVLEFEPGTSRNETAVVQSVSATSPGYASVTVTLSANLTFTHPIGSVVTEQLPSSTLNVSQWDSQALFMTSASNAPSY